MFDIGNLGVKKFTLDAVWHGEVFAFFTALRRLPGLIVINHPFWYMKPIHIVISLFGVEKIFLGSTGNGGREAAQKLIGALKVSRYSTLVP